MEYKLSFLIPANNELFLKNTVDDLLANTQAEIIVCLDGKWADPAIPQNPRVNVIYLPESIGQRAATNVACKLAQGKYVCKVDAHCSFDKDWDLKMIEAFEKSGDNVVMVSGMKNLHVFDWKCFKCGRKIYQDCKPICPDCGNDMKRKMVWQPRSGTSQFSYSFDSEPHFAYFGGYRQHPDYIRDLPSGITESMSLQGSCWMVTKDNYWKLNLGDENFGSWGSQGIQIACSMWLSGGRVLVNHNTFYSHLFRTKPQNDFGFPYKQHESKIQNAKQYAKKLIYENKWPKQIRPSSWILEHFWPVPGWTDEQLEDLKLVGSKFVSPTILVSSPNRITGLAESPMLSEIPRRQEVSSDTMGLSGLNSTIPITTQNINSVGRQP